MDYRQFYVLTSVFLFLLEALCCAPKAASEENLESLGGSFSITLGKDPE